MDGDRVRRPLDQGAKARLAARQPLLHVEPLRHIVRDADDSTVIGSRPHRELEHQSGSIERRHPRDVTIAPARELTPGEPAIHGQLDERPADELTLRGSKQPGGLVVRVLDRELRIEHERSVGPAIEKRCRCLAGHHRPRVDGTERFHRSRVGRRHASMVAYAPTSDPEAKSSRPGSHSRPAPGPLPDGKRDSVPPCDRSVACSS